METESHEFLCHAYVGLELLLTSSSAVFTTANLASLFFGVG